ncbi:hypothetical protein KAU55_06455, partial [Candidatus Bathyarchaeota archaeon]|nr:hypothetical protein [Candidatus Bathyarchaeota archaeon]
MSTLEKQDAVVSARVPIKLKRLVEEFIHKDTHLNESDLLREALREKIRREAPDLYRRILQEAFNEQI